MHSLIIANRVRSFPEGSEPIGVPDGLNIARKPKTNSESAPDGMTNGKTNDTSNVTSNRMKDVAAVVSDGSSDGKRKRTAAEASLDDSHPPKKGRPSEGAAASNVDEVTIEEAGDGTIVIGD